METHQLKMSSQKYPDGLRIFECELCRYALAAEVDLQEVILVETAVAINRGNLDVAHTLFQTYDQPPTLTVSAEIQP